MVGPAVVRVDTSTVVTSPSSGYDGGMYPWGGEERVESGSGSGIITDGRKGLVMTNYHVIKGATEGKIKITLTDGRSYDAKVKGGEERRRSEATTENAARSEATSGRLLVIVLCSI